MSPEKKITVEVWESLTVVEAVEQIRAALMRREGEVMTEALAIERARNIAQGLVDCAIVGS